MSASITISDHSISDHSISHTNTLPGKYKKLLLLSYWLLSNISISDEMRINCFQKLKLYDTTTEQIKFYEEFYINEKQTAKQCKKIISLYQKEQKEKQIPVISGDKIQGRDKLLHDAFINKLITKLLADRT
jgi:hypothetical protein